MKSLAVLICIGLLIGSALGQKPGVVVAFETAGESLNFADPFILTVARSWPEAAIAEPLDLKSLSHLQPEVLSSTKATSAGLTTEISRIRGRALALDQLEIPPLALRLRREAKVEVLRSTALAIAVTSALAESDQPIAELPPSAPDHWSVADRFDWPIDLAAWVALGLSLSALLWLQQRAGAKQRATASSTTVKDSFAARLGALSRTEFEPGQFASAAAALRDFLVGKRLMQPGDLQLPSEARATLDSELVQSIDHLLQQFRHQSYSPVPGSGESFAELLAGCQSLALKFEERVAESSDV